MGEFVVNGLKDLQDIRLCDCAGSRTHNHLVHKPTINHLTKLVSVAKWLRAR